jgi:hypothetical protein
MVYQSKGLDVFQKRQHRQTVQPDSDERTEFVYFAFSSFLAVASFLSLSSFYHAWEGILRYVWWPSGIDVPNQTKAYEEPGNHGEPQSSCVMNQSDIWNELGCAGQA